MNIIVDANIIFAALIQEGPNAELLFDSKLEVYTVDFFYIELINHKAEVFKKTRRGDFAVFLEAINDIFTVIPSVVLWPHVKEALELCPDPDDIPYFAAALYLDCPIWSNDKKLKEQDKVKVDSTDELSKLLLM